MIEVLELREGDVLIFRLAERVSEVDLKIMGDSLQKIFPGNAVGVLQPGAELTVVKRK